MNNNTNDKKSLNCPNCSATVYKDDNSYSVTCPFCDSEIWFNEIKEEAEVIRIRDNYEQALSEQEASFQQSEKYYSDLKRWKLKRNILLATVFLLGLGFGLFGEENEELNDFFVGSAVLIALLAPVFITALHPFKIYYPQSTLKAEKRPVVVLQFLSLIAILFVSIFIFFFLGLLAAFVLLEYVFTTF